MSASRRTRLVDCDPKWVEDASGVVCYLHFDCPEGHDGCSHTIPFVPALDGSTKTFPHAHWERRGDTFEALTLEPSIKRHPLHKDREAAIAAGCIPEYVEESMFCAMHVNLIDGTFHFSGDSR